MSTSKKKQGKAAKSPKKEEEEVSLSPSPSPSPCPSPSPSSFPSSSPSGADPLRLIREDFKSLAEYKPVKPLAVVAQEIGVPIAELAKLNANENLYGPLPEAVVACAHAIQHIYPDPDQTFLRDALETYTGVPKNQIVCGTGSDELIDLLIRLVLPKAILINTPTFSMYSFLAKISQARVVDVPRGPAPRFDIDVSAMVQAIRQQEAKLVFIASPNNPTGLCVSNDDIARLCQEEALIVLDEAYAEFAPRTAINLLSQYPNLIVMRTFSKWAGLAGLRLGYLVAHPALCSKLMQMKQPYNVNVAAEAAAISSLENRAKVFKAVKAILYEKQRLLINVEKLSYLKAIPSDSNFVLFEVTQGKKPRELEAELKKRGVLVRCYAGDGQNVLDKYIRFSIGRPEDTDRLLVVLREIDGDKTNNSDLVSLFLPKDRDVYNNACKAILFDMDGVLADVSTSYRQAIIDTAAHYGVKISNDVISDYKNKGNANNDWVLTLRIITEYGKKSGITLEEVTQVFQQFYIGTPQKPGLRDTERLLINKDFLAQLATHYPLAVVTGRPRDEAIYFLRFYDIEKYFKTLVCMEDGPPKPDPTPVRLALERLQLRLAPGEFAYMIGDTPDDLRSATAASELVGFPVVPLGIIPPHKTDKTGVVNEGEMALVKVLYNAGASRVFATLNELAPLVFSSSFVKFSIYDDQLELPKSAAPSGPAQRVRSAKISRITNETKVECELLIDGTGKSNIRTGLGFLDHMLSSLAKHSSMDISLHCTGDLWIDDHHSAEDCAIVLGQTFQQALGDKRGITRFGSAYAPLDEALARAVIDISGRPQAEIALALTREKIGEISSEMLEHCLRSFATAALITLHVDVIRGTNNHHKAEAAFKATAVALKAAVARTASQAIPSTKGVL